MKKPFVPALQAIQESRNLRTSGSKIGSGSRPRASVDPLSVALLGGPGYIGPVSRYIRCFARWLAWCGLPLAQAALVGPFPVVPFPTRLALFSICLQMGFPSLDRVQLSNWSLVEGLNRLKLCTHSNYLAFPWALEASTPGRVRK